MYTLGKAARIGRSEMKLNMVAQAHDQRVADDNAAFAKASPARKRVIIAKDVLKWIGDGKVIPVAGVYLSPKLRDSTGEYLFEGCELVDGRVKDDRVNGGRCCACALGAVFVCAVEREGGKENFWLHHSSGMQEHLAPYFDRGQLELIEAAFECNEGFVAGGDLATRDLAEAAERFGLNIGRDKSMAEPRMRAIMKNIIANKGTFIP